MKDARRRRSLLKDLSAHGSIQNAVFELAKSTSNCEIPLSVAQKKALIRHHKWIQLCAADLQDPIARQKAVVQSGGWLNVVIPALLSLLLNSTS